MCEDGSCAKTRHWMDSALAGRVRVAPRAADANEARWMRHALHDARARFNASITDGVVPTPPGDRTFGLHHAGEFPKVRNQNNGANAPPVEKNKMTS